MDNAPLARLFRITLPGKGFAYKRLDTRVGVHSENGQWSIRPSGAGSVEVALQHLVTLDLLAPIDTRVCERERAAIRTGLRRIADAVRKPSRAQ